MKIYEITDPEFVPYGKAVNGIEVQPFLNVLKEKTPLPDAPVYVSKEPFLQNLSSAEETAESLYGGLETQFGWCNGHNTKLNCLEYHRNSEFNLGTEEFVLLVAKIDEIQDGKLNTSAVKAFRVPAGILVEVYGTTLHFTPCHTDKNKGFKVMIVLPDGTNTEKPKIKIHTLEDRYLWAKNKWLLAHADSMAAKKGAYIGLCGENIDISL
jgi:hypothetical protein